MAHNLRLIEKLRHSQHTKKTIQEIRKQLLQHSHRLNNHRIKLPFDFMEMSKRELLKRSPDERYFVISKAHKRRQSLFQKESQANHSQFHSQQSSRELNDSMIIKRPIMQMGRRQSETKILKTSRVVVKQEEKEVIKYISTDFESRQQQKSLKRFHSQRLPVLKKIKRTVNQELTPW